MSSLETNSIYDYLYDLMEKELYNMFCYSKNYNLDVNPMYEKEYEETKVRISNLKTIASAVVSTFMNNKKVITPFGTYIVSSEDVYIKGIDSVPSLDECTYEGVFDCWRIFKTENKVLFIFIPYKDRRI